MKIVHIITSLEKGGAEEMLKRLLRVDMSDAKDVTVIALRGECCRDEDLIRAGYAIKTLNISGVQTLLVGVIRLFWILKKLKPDIVQTWLYHSDLIGGLVGRFAGCKNVIWNLRCEAITLRRAGVRSMVVFKMCGLLSHVIPRKIICVGENAKKSHSRVGFCSRKMIAIVNGYDTEKFKFSLENRQKIRASFGVKDNEILIGCVGRFHSDKGQDVLLRSAVEILCRSLQVKFILVGRGCTYEKLEILNIRPDLRERILMIGEHANIPEILSSFDIYCMPSRTEGFPNSLAEAMLVGLPCVATWVGDTSYLAGGTVLLVEPENSKEMEEKIIEIVNMKKEEKIRMGIIARERIVTNFSIGAIREIYYSLYLDTLTCVI